MSARQRVLTLILIFLVLFGNCVNLFIARQRAISIVKAAEPPQNAAENSDANEPIVGIGQDSEQEAVIVTRAFNADGTEHDLQQCKLLHINWATEKELQQLPGIGPVLAKRIIEKRTERFFVEFKDLLAVPGIGEKRLAQIKPQICVAIPHVAD